MITKEHVKQTFEALEDKKAIDIQILDISGITVLADYMIIAGGANKNQVQALADSVQESLAKEKIYPKHIEGYQSANWILLDYGDMIVHVFNQDDRLFYDLERLWQDGKKIELEP